VNLLSKYSYDLKLGLLLLFDNFISNRIFPLLEIGPAKSCQHFDLGS
jgi:hypothetical protein